MKSRMLPYKICVDQGSPQSGDAYGMFVGPITKRAARRLHRDVRDYLLLISNVHTSLRQASEWGMHGLQGTFPRCKKRLPSDPALCRLVVEAIVLVHNYRTDFIGYSQIRLSLTLSMFGVKIWKDMTESLSITSARGNMTARMMARKVLVMVLARTTRSYNIIMIMITSKWINY
jgi:hypothetical protein